MTINKIKEFIVKYKKLIALLVLIVIFCFVLFYQPKDKTNVNKTKQSEVSDEQNKSNQNNSNSEVIELKDIISPTPEMPLDGFDITNSDPAYPLKPFLPYKGDGFTVEGYIAPLVLRVKVKNKSDISKVEPNLKKWLSENELVPNWHKVNWKYEQ